MANPSNLIVALGLGLAAVAPANAQSSSPPAVSGPPAAQRDEVIAVLQLRPGQSVAEIIPGQFTRPLSAAVGPRGRLYSFVPTEVSAKHPEVAPSLAKTAKSLPDHNLTIVQGPFAAMSLPTGLDAVFIRQNYHDLYTPFAGPTDVPNFNRQVFAALKPGGVYVIQDHAAAAGAGVSVVESLHRIEREAVVAEVSKAGFVLDGESAAFANSADDHKANIFDPTIRGKTDQFLLRFRKPK